LGQGWRCIFFVLEMFLSLLELKQYDPLVITNSLIGNPSI